VIFIEGETLYGSKGEVPEEEYLIPLGVADVKREGRDVTILAWSKMVATAQAAADTLAADDVSCEVVDLRTLRPLDEQAILDSVRRTNRCVVVEEGWPYAGVGAQLADLIEREAFDDLDAPVERLTGADVPMPYAKNLEHLAMPWPERVVEAVRRVMYLE
jgi:pyruvate dehydrogenase E1 component beta subunit